MELGYTFRPNTQDEDTFHSVVHKNEYQLPEKLRGDELVVDIGMNIGSFCFAALTRGAGEVHGYEPDPSNFDWAAQNLRRFGNRIHLHHGAVWRSDQPGRQLFLDPARFGLGEVQFTACYHVFNAGGGQEVPTIPLDDLIRDVTLGGARRIDLMKIDCEGAEYPILFTSRMLHLVNEIVGEYHNFEVGAPPDHPFHHIPDEAKVAGIDHFTVNELTDFLRRSGYEVTTVAHPIIPHALGNFFARRPRITSTGFRGKVRRVVGRIRRKIAS